MNSKKFLIIAACLCIGLLAQAQVKLSFNPAKGETYLYRFTAEQSVKQAFMGQEMLVKTTLQWLIEMTIKEKSANEITMDYVYREVTMDVSSPMVSIKFDSNKPVEGLTGLEKSMALVLNSFVGNSMKVVFSPDGSVKSIAGAKEIMQEAQKNMPSADMASQQILESYTQTFSDESMKSLFEQSFNIYPGKEVKAGDSWDKKYTLRPGRMNSDVKNTYTLKSVQNNNAVLDVTSTIVMKPGMEMGMDGTISGTQNGEITLNAQTGMLTHSTTTQTLKGILSTQGIDVEMDMKSKATVARER